MTSLRKATVSSLRDANKCKGLQIGGERTTIILAVGLVLQRRNGATRGGVELAGLE